MSLKHIINIYKNQIESLEGLSLLLNNPTLENSQWVPGNNESERSLLCRVKTSVPFLRNTGLCLRLASYTNTNNEKVVIDGPPIVAETFIRDPTLIVEFKLTSSRIPLPNGLLYLPTILQEGCNPMLISGNVKRYHMILSFVSNEKRCKPQYVTPGIPVVLHVNSNAFCDYKCEKIEVSEQPTDDFTIKIICRSQNQTVYVRSPHCVTHCQAPKPLLQYYIVNGSEDANQSIDVSCPCRC